MKRLQATKDRAATLARMMQASSGIGATSSNEGGSSGPVAVRISSNIPAGDSGLKDATLMGLDGGVLVDTKQTIKVRHVGDAAIAAGTIVTPERCGRLGLCFVRTVQVVNPAVTLYRPLRLEGPIAPEGGVVADYTEAWSFGAWQTRAMYYVPQGWATSGYYASCDFSTTPNAPDPSDSRGWNWIKYMQPMRYKIDSYQGEFSQPLYDHQGNKPISGYFGVLRIGEASVAGVGGHLSPFMIQSIGTPGTGVMSTGGLAYSKEFPSLGTEYPISTPEQPTPITGRYYQSWRYIAARRIWIDGVDATGIISLGVPGRVIEPAEYIGKSVWIDVWAQYIIRLSAKGASGETVPANGTLGAVRQIGWVDPTNNGYPCALSSRDYSQAITVTGTRFSLAFDVNGPFGLSSLAMETNASTGWTLLTHSNQQEMQKQTGFITEFTPGNGAIRVSIILAWLESDRPLITYRREVYTISGASGYWTPKQWYYRPEPSAGFTATVALNGYGVQAGVWNPTVASAFKLIAGSNYSTNRTELRNAGDGTIPKTDWLTVPQTITVTQV